MFPLSAPFFMPSLFVTPVVLVAFFVLRRRSGAYRNIWRWAIFASLVLCGVFLMQVLSTPLYSQRDKSPDNPGGFSVSLYAVIALMIFETCIVIPAFPVLIGLAFLPPSGWDTRKRSLLVVAAIAYVGVLAWMITAKNTALAADYRQSKQQERLQRIQWRQEQQRIQQQQPIQFQWRKPPQQN